MATAVHAIIVRIDSSILQYCPYNSNVESIMDIFDFEQIMLEYAIYEC